jgi:galactose mutarotase-like enzyme
MEHVIENGVLRISVEQTGAELCSIQSVSTGREYMWNANPEIWGSHSPVLFPIIGKIKDNSYFYKGKEYKLQGHGFIRNNRQISMEKQENDCLTFSLCSSEETLRMYPFKFKFTLAYKLEHNQIIVLHSIHNAGKGTMFFSLGGHPAFKCPVTEDEKYNDYFLEFEKQETALCWGPMENGLMDSKTRSIIEEGNKIFLDEHIFDKGALVFKKLNSSRIYLTSRKYGPVIRLNYNGFHYLGIWAKPKARFVCIEPWLGIADSWDSNQILKDKEGMLSLEPGETFKASFSIEIISAELC